MFEPPVQRLIDELSRLPGVGQKSAQRLAFHILNADEADAIRIANDTSFGLGASVYTSDVDRGERIAAEQLDAGNCFVNGIVKSDPRLPFGGTKASGYGRELSPLGILEFTNAKTVWVK